MLYTIVQPAAAYTGPDFIRIECSDGRAQTFTDAATLARLRRAQPTTFEVMRAQIRADRAADAQPLGR